MWENTIRNPSEKMKGSPLKNRTLGGPIRQRDIVFYILTPTGRSFSEMILKCTKIWKIKYNSPKFFNSTPDKNYEFFHYNPAFVLMVVTLDRLSLR